MKVTVNGNLTEVDPVRTVAELLGAYGVPPGSVLIEQNGNVIAQSDFQTTTVSEGDAIEIVRMVAGG